MTEQEAINLTRGKDLDTPTFEIRVFHFNDPEYTYEFVRQEGSYVLVVDDHNGKSDKNRTLKSFSADELVNTVVFTETLLRGNETPLPPRTPNHLELLEKTEKMFGGTNPFETPIGPAKECLSSNQVVVFIKNGENDEVIKNHIKDCDFCRGRVEGVKRYKAER